MKFEDAIQLHSEWRVKFRSAISLCKPMDESHIAKDYCCELGRWLHGEGKEKHGKLDSFSNCVSSHATFHIEAAKVAEAINAMKFSDAWHMLEDGTTYANASNEVVRNIMKLKEELDL